jgi:hypothetical protein
MLHVIASDTSSSADPPGVESNLMHNVILSEAKDLIWDCHRLCLRNERAGRLVMDLSCSQ